MLVLMTGCSSERTEGNASPGGKTPSATVSSGSPFTIPTATTGAPCVESPRLPPDQALRGTAEGGELWALGGQPRVGEDFKLVVRVTGSGELSAVAVSPTGSRHDPTATQEHLSSNFDRPGDEWGLFFVFDQAGCWQIVVERADLEGFITISVAST